MCVQKLLWISAHLLYWLVNLPSFYQKHITSLNKTVIQTISYFF